MEIYCLDGINFPRLSEILLEGFILGLTVVAAYIIGRVQSDINWRREVTLREKEQKEREQNELLLSRIDALRNFFQSLLEYLDFSTNLKKTRYPRHAEVISEKSINLRNAIRLTTPFFPEEYDPELYKQIKIVEDHISNIKDNQTFQILFRITEFELSDEEFEYIMNEFSSLGNLVEYFQERLNNLVEGYS